MSCASWRLDRTISWVKPKGRCPSERRPFPVRDHNDYLRRIVGWTGALFVLGAYLGVSSGRMAGDSAAFQWLNAIGAAFFVLNTWWHGAIPSMALNIIWSGIGFVALWRIARRARDARG